MFWDFPLWEGDARGKKSDLGEPFRRIRHIRRRPVGAQQVDPLGEAFHLTADVRMGNIRIDLRRAYILMSKQFTDGFDGYSLRKGDCRGERMPGRMERDLFLDTRLGDDLVEAFIAPPVAREFEYASGTRCGHIIQKDIVGHGKQPYIDLRPRFAAGRVDPQLFVYFLNILRHQASDVDIGQSGEATKQKRVPDKL